MRRKRKRRRTGASSGGSLDGGSSAEVEAARGRTRGRELQLACTCRNSKQQLKVKPPPENASTNNPQQVQPIEALTSLSKNPPRINNKLVASCCRNGDDCAASEMATTYKWPPMMITTRRQARICCHLRCHNDHNDDSEDCRRLVDAVCDGGSPPSLWNKSARSAIVVVCLTILIVMLLGSSFQASLCDLQQQQPQTPKLVESTTVTNDRKLTVIGQMVAKAEVDEGSSGMANSGGRQQQQKRKLAQHELRRKSVTLGSFDFGQDSSLSSAALVVRGGDEAQLGCHLLGRPIEFNGSGWKTSAIAEAKLKANNNGPTGAGSHQDTIHEPSIYGPTSGSSFSEAGDGLTLPPMVLDGQGDQDKSVDLDENDLVSLVFWYKDDNPTPIYTLDARQVAALTHTVPYYQPKQQHNKEQQQQSIWANGTRLAQDHRDKTSQHSYIVHHPKPSTHSSEALPLSLSTQGGGGIKNNRQLLADAKHYSSPTGSAGRLRLDISSQFPIIKLIIRNTNGQDSGEYKCRIDFRRSRTISQFVGLLVEVPISRLEIGIGPPPPPASAWTTGRGDTATTSAKLGQQASVGGGGGDHLDGGDDDDDDAGEPPELGRSKLAAEVDDELALPEAVFSENQVAQFTCLAFDASPAPTISWLIRWPEQQQQQQPSSLVSGPDETQQLLIDNNNRTLRHGARLEANPMTRDQLQDWLLATTTSGESNPLDGQAPAAEVVGASSGALVVGSRLVVAPLTRNLHGIRVGCRASQRLTLGVAPGKQPTTFSSSKNTSHRGQKNNQASRRPGQNSYSSSNRKQPGQQIFGANRSEIRMVSVQTNVTNNITNANNERTLPAQNLQLTKWFELKLRLSPQKIEILSEQARPEVEGQNLWVAELSEGQSGKFLCSSRGSQPGAKLRWSRLDGSKAPVSSGASGWRVSSTATTSASPRDPGGAEGDSSSSLLEITPVSWRHHLAQLVCTATNEELEPNGISLTAKIKLLVKFKPIVRLLEWPPTTTNEPSLTAANKTHQQDVSKSGRRLKCSVQSNPPINQLVWLVNERPLARVTAETQQQFHRPKPPAASATMAAATSAPPASPRKRNRLPKSRVGGPPFGGAGTGSEITSAARIATDGASINEDADTDTDDDDGDEFDESRMEPKLAGPASDTDQPNEQLLQTNWSLTPLLPAAIDGSKYSIDGNLLTVTNLTKLDQQDEYKCLAINSLGQGTSQGFQLSIDYKPVCLTSEQQQQHYHSNGKRKAEVENFASASASASRLDATLGLGLEADQIWQVDQSSGSVQCQVEARPAPTRFAWSFVPLGELVRLAEGRKRNRTSSRDEDIFSGDKEQVPLALLNQSASLWLETDGRELSYQELLTRLAGLEGHRNQQNQQHQHGLLLCRAQNSVGWQVKPCVNLVLTPELLEPSAGNCSVEPLIERRSMGPDGNASTELLQEQQQQHHLAISVDCSRARNKDKLLFQLAISRRDDANGIRGTGTGIDHHRAPAATATTWRNKRLLFTEPADNNRPDGAASLGQAAATTMPTRRIPMSDLLADLKETGQENNNEDLQQQPSSVVELDPGTGQPEVGVQKDQQLMDSGSGGELRKLRRGQAGQPQNLATTGGRVMTLSEQVGLLNELVFSISASNLMQTSEPHAILGSQLSLPEVVGQLESGHQQQQQQLNRPGASQVSRSASHADSLTDNEGQQQTPQAPMGNSNGHHVSTSPQPQQSAGGARRAGSTPPIRQQADLLALGNGGTGGQSNWASHHLEANIILIAIGGTAILSALTLTLIILLLRGRATASPANRQAAKSNQWFQGAGEVKSSQSIVYGNGGEFLLTSRPPTPIKPPVNTSSTHSNSRLTTSPETDSATTTTNRVDFLAPPVRGTSKPVALNSVHQPMGGVMNGQNHLLHSGSHLSLVQGCLGSEAAYNYHHQATETLYVIGGGGGEGGEGTSLDQVEEAGNVVDVSFTDEPCGTSGGCSGTSTHRHLLAESGAIDHHLLASHQALSYCSPSICNSSSHHESSLAALTTTTTPTRSDHHEFVISNQELEDYTNGRSLGTMRSQPLGSTAAGSFRMVNLGNIREAEGKLTTTAASLTPAGGNVNSMYLFSFL